MRHEQVSADGGLPGSGWIIGVAGFLFSIGIALLALAVWIELPGPLAAYGDPTAGWPIGLQVLLGLIAFATWRWQNRGATRAFTVVLLAVGVGCVLVLSVASYARCPEAGRSAGWSVATQVLALLTNNYGTDVFAEPGCRLDGPPLALQVARLAQLLVLILAATSAVFALLRSQLDRVAVRFARRLFLVVGADESASVLMPALGADAAGMTRAVLTPDPAASWLPMARAGGWRVVIGDPESPDLLRSLLVRRGGRRALRGLAVLPPDSATTGRLVRAVEQVVADTHSPYPVRALLRIDDAWQAEDWRRRYLGQPERWVVDTISANEVTALTLLRDALDRGADQLVLVGRSELTFAMLSEAAHQSRERLLDDLDPVPPIDLVGPAAQRVLAEHELAERGFGNQTTRSITTHVDESPEMVVADLVEQRHRPAVFFTGDEDAEDRRLAARLGAVYPRILVYSRVPQLSGLGLEPLLAQVRGFGVTLETGSGRPIDRWERIARLLHARFISANPDPSRASRRPWDEGLPAFYRESNVRQVTIALGSAIAVGRSWGATGVIDPAPPTADQIDLMARADHESWRRHHEENGWRWAAERDDKARRHPDLVGWERARRGESHQDP